MRTRLDGEFGGAYRYFEAVFGGRNPYMEAIDANLAYLKIVLQTRRWSMLRREPPCFTWEKNPLQNMRALVIDHLKTTVAAALALIVVLDGIEDPQNLGRHVEYGSHAGWISLLEGPGCFTGEVAVCICHHLPDRIERLVDRLNLVMGAHFTMFSEPAASYGEPGFFGERPQRAGSTVHREQPLHEDRLLHGRKVLQDLQRLGGNFERQQNIARAQTRRREGALRVDVGQHHAFGRGQAQRLGHRHVDGLRVDPGPGPLEPFGTGLGLCIVQRLLKEARAAGIDFEELCWQVLETSFVREPVAGVVR